MKLGICTGPENAAKAKKSGFDYIEVGANGIAAMTDAEFSNVVSLIEASGLEAEAANCVLPGTIRADGPDFDRAKLADYSAKLMPRLSVLGVRSLVFGSGGSRKVPAEYPMKTAFEELVESARILSEAAGKFGITVVAEPLNTSETNIINTVGEAAEWAEAVDRPSFRILADYFHMGKMNEGFANLIAYGPWLKHVHIAHPETRLVPLPGDGGNYESFFAALRKAGYDSRVSFEGSVTDYDAQIPVMIDYLRGLMAI